MSAFQADGAGPIPASRTVGKMKHYKVLVITFAAVAVGVVAAVVFDVDLEGAQSLDLPPQFANTYRSATGHGHKVVKLTSEVQELVSKINGLDLEGKSGEALLAIGEAEKINEAAKGEALSLALELQKLVKILDKHATFMQRNALLSAVDVEIALVQEFVRYTGSISSFLAALREAITSGTYENRAAVYDKLEEVNEYVTRINRLNGEFVKRIE